MLFVFRIIKLGQSARIYFEKIGQSQKPHEKDGANESLLLPATAGGQNGLMETEGSAKSFQNLTQSNIFHEVDLRKTADLLKEIPLYKDSLIASGDPGKLRPPVHQKLDDAEQGMLS